MRVCFKSVFIYETYIFKYLINELKKRICIQLHKCLIKREKLNRIRAYIE